MLIAGTSCPFSVLPVDAFDIEAMEKTIKEEVAKDEVSVIIACAPCALLKGVKFPYKCRPLSEKCKKCGMCLKPGCPALTKNEDGTIAIDETSVTVVVCVNSCANLMPLRNMRSRG